jgi:hypothetical protein
MKITNILIFSTLSLTASLLSAASIAQNNDSATNAQSGEEIVIDAPPTDESSTVNEDETPAETEKEGSEDSCDSCSKGN